MNSAHLVVMAGGSGTRFWPKSTSKQPKQLLKFGHLTKDSLLQQTLGRFSSLIPKERHWVVTTSTLAEAVSQQAGGATILQEPQGRNTAPCIYWAAREIQKRDPEAIMVVMPADHLIQNGSNFQGCVQKAIQWASRHRDLITLGIRPSRPETGYGYLKTGSSVGELEPFQVDAFVEKPDEARAKKFLASGDYLWNGGMFVWKVSVILSEFDRLMPEMRQAWEDSNGRVEQAYPRMTATSIDFGIMEKANSVVTFPLDCGWDDLGSWTSVELLARERGEALGWGVALEGSVISIDSTGLVVDAPGRTVAALGVKDLILVDTGKVIMIAEKSKAQDIKKLVEEVKKTRADLV